jgi:hypothetical protein
VQNVAVFNVAGVEPKYLAIFDHTGAPVQSLVNTNTWDGRDIHGRMVPPGVYLYRISGSGFETDGRLVKTR